MKGRIICTFEGRVWCEQSRRNTPTRTVSNDRSIERLPMEKRERKILIVEDSPTTALSYKKVLSDAFDVTLCRSGRDAQVLIKRKSYFQLAIMDMVLPPEGTDDFALKDCRETGLRLMESMILHGTCLRFYVITGLKDWGARVERLAEELGALCRFDYKMDISPERLRNRIDNLLSTPLLGYTLGGLRMVAEETRDYLELCRSLSSSVPTFTEDEVARVAAAMKWLYEALNNPWYHEFYHTTVLTDEKMLAAWTEWMNTLAEIKILLQAAFGPRVHGALQNEIESAIVAILSFLNDFGPYQHGD